MIKKLRAMGKWKAGAAVAGILIVGWGAYSFLKPKGAPAQLITVKRGSIVETVSVTGNTTPVHSLDLAFQNGGMIALVAKPVGTPVRAGDLIARLDTAQLAAQLAQAQANVDVQEADLRSLQAGSRPEDIQSARAALQKSQQDLLNMYGRVTATLADAFAKANDAVRNQLASFFTNAETVNPQLTFAVNDSQITNNIQSQRVAASAELNDWQEELLALNPLSSTTTLDAALAKGNAHLAAVNSLLITASQALVELTNQSSVSTANYKTALTAALNEVSAAITNVNTASQNIASQKYTVSGLQAALDKAVAGPTADDIQAQQAQVEQAQASVQNIEAQIAQASLVSPINSVITVQNAKVGQIASPGQTLVSIISNTDLEVDADVPETDIGKIAVGDPVSMSFEALPNETFTGKVFYIDPAETIISGVVDYLVKTSFDNLDPRNKSGLTENLNIKAEEKDNVLILPQFAILQNDQGTFVDLYKNGASTQVPVVLGIRDDQGNVEITSGVNEGDEVLNIGLK